MRVVRRCAVIRYRHDARGELDIADVEFVLRVCVFIRVLPWPSLSSRAPRGRERRAAVMSQRGDCTGNKGTETDGLWRDDQRQRWGGCEQGGDGAAGCGGYDVANGGFHTQARVVGTQD